MEREGSPNGSQDPVPAVHVDGRVPSTHEDPFPKVVGRTRPTFMVSTVDGIALVESPEHALDEVNVRSATAMSGGE